MRSLRRILFAGLVIQASFSSIAQEISGNADMGATLYYDNACYSCHGFNGTGRVPLANDVSGIMVNETVFLTFLRQRSELNPLNPTNAIMPNYDASTLSDAEALDIYAYIKSLRDDPPEISDDPLMQEILDAARAADPRK